MMMMKKMRKKGKKMKKCIIKFCVIGSLLDTLNIQLFKTKRYAV